MSCRDKLLLDTIKVFIKQTCPLLGDFFINGLKNEDNV